MTKYASCGDAKDVCEWLDGHSNIFVIAITQGRFNTYTIFYREYNENDVLKAFAACCDPGFNIPTDHIVQPIRTAPSSHKDAAPQPSVVC